MTFLSPFNPHIQFSDYVSLSTYDENVRFGRLLECEGGFQFDNPGARIRFCTDATYIVVRLHYNALHTRLDAVNGIGVWVYDGQVQGTYQATERPSSLHLNLEVVPDGSPHLYEVVLPYGESVEFHGLDVNQEATFSSAPARPDFRWVAYGDSITHGFRASDVTKNYPFRVGQIQNWQVINMGFGSRQATASDGSVLAQLNPDLVTIAIGVNDCLHSKPLANFEANIQGLIANIRATRIEAPICLITPLSVPQGGWDNVEVRLETYRQVLRDLVQNSGDAHLSLIEGPQLIPSKLAYFHDGLHPNDAGFELMAHNLSSQLSQLTTQQLFEHAS